MVSGETREAARWQPENQTSARGGLTPGGGSDRLKEVHPCPPLADPVVDFGLSRPYISRVPVRLAFVRPLSPSAAVSPPKGDDWLHEPKWDGFRFQIIKDGGDVRGAPRTSID
jgi:hypothetical protein